jgi:acetolactate synthase-1/2/3 large subunit
VVLGQRNRPCNERMEGACDAYLPDFVALAEAHGAVGVRIEDPAEVVPTLERAFKCPRVWVMDFRVTPEENVLPMVPPGGTVEQIIHRLA